MITAPICITFALLILGIVIGLWRLCRSITAASKETYEALSSRYPNPFG